MRAAGCPPRGCSRGGWQVGKEAAHGGSHRRRAQACIRAVASRRAPLRVEKWPELLLASDLTPPHPSTPPPPQPREEHRNPSSPRKYPDGPFAGVSVLRPRSWGDSSSPGIS